MNREIKFRAWLEPMKKIVQLDRVSCIPQYTSVFHNGIEDFTQERVVTMQYTGLKDKNGNKEIYEGDKMGEGIVKWNDANARFILEGKDWAHDMIYASKNYEVTGNIYEN